jgi:hypothetical protein
LTTTNSLAAAPVEVDGNPAASVNVPEKAAKKAPK